MSMHSEGEMPEPKTSTISTKIPSSDLGKFNDALEFYRISKGTDVLAWSVAAFINAYEEKANLVFPLRFARSVPAARWEVKEGEPEAPAGAPPK